MMCNRFLILILIILFVPDNLFAQDNLLSLNIPSISDASMSSRVLQIIFLVTILSIAPSILIMVTSFTRIVVVLSFLRNAIGIQQSPPNTVLISLAIFLTSFVMMPTFEKAYNDAIHPLIEQQISEEEAIQKLIIPFHTFMVNQTREKDLSMLTTMAKLPVPETTQDIPLRTLLPAFMLSELRKAFEMGFLLFVPFLIIDMLVSATLMTMGMMMLPPVIISLPFKILFFILIDGWHMVSSSLIQSFNI